MKILNDDIKLNYLSYELSNTIKEYNLKKDEKVFIKTLNELQKNLPSCSQEDILKVVNIIINLEKEKNNEKSKIVFTGPTSFLLKQTKIWDEVKSMLVHAENSITLTGYSVSDYFDEMQSLIIEKASQCVCIKLYINDFEKHEDVLANLLAYKKTNKYIQIFKYIQPEDDKMAALHAKMIVVDECKSLISSANQVYILKVKTKLKRLKNYWKI